MIWTIEGIPIELKFFFVVCLLIGIGSIIEGIMILKSINSFNKKSTSIIPQRSNRT